MEYTDPLQPTAALTPDQQGLASNAGIAAGQAGSPWTASTPVTMGSLTTPTPINLPPVPPTNTSAADATVASSVAAATPTGAPPTETQNKANTLTDQISALLGQDTGRAQALSDAEKASGAVDLQKQLTDLNGQIGVKSAEYDKMFANLGGNGVVETSGVLAAQQAGLRLARAADIGLLTARAQATQGNLQLANETAAKAVDLKYSQIEDQLKVKQSQLALLKDTLDREYAQQDKADARKYDEKIKALDRQYNEQQQKIADEKAQAKENVNLALSAAISTKFVNKSGQFFDAATGQPFADPAAFFKAAGVKSFEEAYQKGLVTDVTPAKLADVQFAQQAQAKYNDVKITPQMTHDEVVAAIQGSKIYKKDTYIAPPAGYGPQKGSLDATNIVDAKTDAKVKALIASRPGDGKYGDAYKAVSTKYGKAVADAYDKVYQGVFNGGQSVDAAFNNAKLGSNGIDSVGSSNPAVKQALDTILGSNKFTAGQKADVTKAINTGQDPIAVIKNQAKDIMGQTQATTLGKYEVAQATLSDLGQQLQAFYDAGGSTNLISGNFEEVYNKLGEVNDPKLVNLATQIQGNLQVYRNAISGTAYSEQEGKDIQSIFPGINKTQDLNKAILSARNTLFQSTIDSTYRTVLGSAYDQLKGDNSGGQTVQSNGQTYIVGQVYNDGTANWVVDAQGHWTQQ